MTDRREVLGQYPTPAPVARYMVRTALGLLDAPAGDLRVLDPAAGEGAFLVAALDELRARSPEAPADRLAAQLFGIEVEHAALAACRDTLAGAGLPAATVRCNVYAGDCLQEVPFEDGTFDVVLLNPPYQGVRHLARTWPAPRRERLRRRFRTARGCYNLAAVMIERALGFLRRGGVLAAIAPAALLENRASEPLRRLLLADNALLELVDLRSPGVFPGVSAYPAIFFVRREAPRVPAEVLCRTAVIEGGEVRPTGTPARRPIAAVAATPGLAIRVLGEEEAWICRALEAGVPLGELCRIACGTPGYRAAETAAALCDGADGPGWPFVVSGTIDRYAIHPGPVRYQRRVYTAPQLARAAVTKGKRDWFDRHKLLVAGVSRRLEVALDDRGRAAGVNVYMLDVPDAALRWALLAYLNAEPVSRLAHALYGARRLRGGHLGLNREQLAQLPVWLPDRLDPLVEAARRLHANPKDTTADAAVDRFVGETLHTERCSAHNVHNVQHANEKPAGKKQEVGEGGLEPPRGRPH